MRRLLLLLVIVTLAPGCAPRGVRNDPPPMPVAELEPASEPAPATESEILQALVNLTGNSAFAGDLIALAKAWRDGDLRTGNSLAIYIARSFARRLWEEDGAAGGDPRDEREPEPEPDQRTLDNAREAEAELDRYTAYRSRE